MKELADAERVRAPFHSLIKIALTSYSQMQRQFMDCVETAAFPGQEAKEIDRLLHMVDGHP